MTDFIVKDGDMIAFTFAPPTQIPAILSPVPLIGSGLTITVAGKPVCVEGDELPPSLRIPLQCMAPPFVIPGMGTLSVQLTPANMTATTTAGGKKILVKGGPFMAKFEISMPAMQPTPTGTVPDPVAIKSGTAEFQRMPPLTDARAG